MDTIGNGESGPENRGGGLLDCSSLGNFTPLISDKVLGMTAIGSEPLYKHWNGVNSSFIAGWTPLDSVAHNVEIVTSSISSHGQIDNSSYTSSTSRLVQFQSDQCLAELEPNLPCFGSGSFSEIDSFSILHRCRWISNSGYSVDYPLEGSGNKNEKSLMSQSEANNYAQSREECKILDEGTMKSSPDGKKRRRACDDWSQFQRVKNMKTEQEKDQCTEEQDEEKPKPKRKPVDSSTSGDALKEDYVHVRAKRGQATNSHSLAERVRREKIRERMKFLQDLVPGCNKITGKAVMLDEIINYVLSLQQQVEKIINYLIDGVHGGKIAGDFCKAFSRIFARNAQNHLQEKKKTFSLRNPMQFLSMKLATVYPETNAEHEQILKRDIRHSQGGSASILGDPGMNSYPKEILQGALLATQSSNLESLHMPNVASMWENELHNIRRTDFISDMAPNYPDSNG